MTLSDHAAKILRLADDLPGLIDDSFKVGVVNLRARIQNRIFVLKKDINGAPLGTYSTAPILVGAKSFRNKTQANAFFSKQKSQRKKAKKAAAKDGTDAMDSNWRTVKGHSLYVLESGYKGLRVIQGMPASEVNLQYTGELAKTGIITKASKGRYQVVFRNELSKDKARGFEATHGGLGRIFGASGAEVEETIDDINDHLTERLKSYV